MTLYFQRLFARYPFTTRRFLEVIPGIISWTLLLFPLWGSLFFPYLLSVCIVVFDVYWLYKSISLATFAFVACVKIKRAERQDWLAKAKKLADFQQVTHVLIIPNYREQPDKMRATLQSIARQTFPRERLFIVLAMEEREAGAREKAEALVEEFRGAFGGIWATYHPDVVGEVKGKSSNEAFAARDAYQRLAAQGQIDLDYATISSVDADSMFDEQYFAYLTYKFLSSPRRHHIFWQSANVAYNNFWRVPAAVRVISVVESMVRTGFLLQRSRLIANSTYSLSFKLLVDVGYWDVDVIPEDYRIFFKAFYALRGKVWVEPVFLKTSMDSPRAGSYLKTLKSKYEQERRWAWGISDTPLFFQWWLTVPGVPFIRKTAILFYVVLEHILWPVYWFLLTVGLRLVPFFSPLFARSKIYSALLGLSGELLTFCLVGFLAMILVDLLNRPYRRDVSIVRQILFPLELVLLPVASLILVTVPGIVSHTQLMLGKRLEYRVTEKM
jgi:cellulose synthase/poly-beta-1,6-N-acetylglucosamine synthase-like glycosyltransferase